MCARRALGSLRGVILSPLRRAKDLCILDDMGPRSYYVYILTNRSKTLYTGVTGKPLGRISDHKIGHGGVFCRRYKIDRLVYFERFRDVRSAIKREKQIIGNDATEENRPDCLHESNVEGPERGMVREAPVPARGKCIDPSPAVAGSG